MAVIYYQNIEHNMIRLDIPGCAKESEGVQYNVKKTKCYNHSWIKNKKGYTPIFLCFTDKIKQGHVRCKKQYTPWIKRLVLSVCDKYYIFLFKWTSNKIHDDLNTPFGNQMTNVVILSDLFFESILCKTNYKMLLSSKNTFHVGNEGLQRSLISTPMIYYFHTTDSVFWCSAIMRTGV